MSAGLASERRGWWRSQQPPGRGPAGAESEPASGVGCEARPSQERATRGPGAAAAAGWPAKQAERCNKASSVKAVTELNETLQEDGNLWPTTMWLVPGDLPGGSSAALN